MAKFIKHNIDGTIENNLVTASILSSKFIEEIYTLYNPQYMKNAFAKTIMSWVLDYFDKFGEAPTTTIGSIFETEKAYLEKADSDIIKTFLDQLSKNYVASQGMNVEYVLDQVLNYFRKREIEIRVFNAQNFLDAGKLEQAEAELTEMKKVMRITSNWENPFETDKIYSVFDETKRGILKFPGAYGELLGDMQRGWLISFLAPFKRGKTQFLQEAAILAVLSGLKAVFISLEMQAIDIRERIYKRITSFGDGEQQKIPVFDCVKNKEGTCVKACRVNRFTLNTNDFTPELDYRPCTACRGTSADYEVTTWFEMMDKPKFSERNVAKKVKSFAKYYGENIRTKCYPRFSASVSDIKRDLDILEQTDGFIPDVIVVDYAGILKPEKTHGENRHGLDEIWKSLAAMAAERHALTFTASQGNRGSIYKENMDQTDLAEWIGILGHVDKMIALNQSPIEKRMGIIRVVTLADRHKEFNEQDQVMVLQALVLGQVHLDSHSK